MTTGRQHDARSGPRVLTVCYGGSHAATLAPVVRRLRTDGVHVTALALTTARSTFAAHGTEFLGYADFVHDTRDADALAFGEELVGDVSGEAVGIPREESVAYLGANLRDLVVEHGEARARQLYAEQGRHAFLPMFTMGRIIDQVAPDLVIATNSPKSELASLLAAEARGIPTLQVPDFTCDPRWELVVPFPARYFAAMSEAARDNLVRHHHADPQAIRVTGQPAFDKSGVASEASCHRAVEEALGARLDAPFVLLLSSTYFGGGTAGETEIERLRSRLPAGLTEMWPGPSGVLALLEALPPGVPAVIKPHPSERIEGFRELVARRPATWVLPGTFEVNAALRAARWVAGGFTTTALVDALCLDRPTIAVDLAGRTDLDLYDPFGVPIATSEAELPALVASLLDGTVESGPQAERRHELARLNANAVAQVAQYARDLLAGIAG